VKHLTQSQQHQLHTDILVVRRGITQLKRKLLTT